MTNKYRTVAIGVFFTLVLALFVVRLYNLQFVHGTDYLTQANESSRKTIRLTGARGKVLDSSGIPLAYNKTTYDLQFVKDPDKKKTDDIKAYTKAIMNTIELVENNGGKTISTFAVRQQEDGSYSFYWGTDVSDEVAARREQLWRDNVLYVLKRADRTGTPEEAYWKLREYYGIPEDANFDTAFKVLSVWQEVSYVSYSISYNPVTVAQNVDMNVVAAIEIDSSRYQGMQINQGRTRVYPNKSLAAHVIGYMSRMLNEDTIEKMKTSGYQQDDLIGAAGIEKTMELELSGNTTERQGSKVVEVDSSGKVIRELADEGSEPTAGNNVMLTIDSKLQAKLEELLAANIAMIQQEQLEDYNAKKDEYDEKLTARSNKTLNLAKEGAAVVMNVQTGEVLAMASYPSYDLNLFTGGLSQETYEQLSSEENGNALFNKAIQSRATPGSIFKMATGLAGLMEGKVTLNTKYTDEGYYNNHVKDGLKGPACWVAPYFSRHTDEDIVGALRDSCNYYFFTVADKLGVDLLNRWADQLGLTSKTNIELPGEVTGQVGNQLTLYDPDSSPGGVASLVYSSIKKLMKDTCTDKQYGLNYTYEDSKYDEAARSMLQLVTLDASNWGPDIRAILINDLKIPKTTITKYGLDSTISQTLTEIKWDPNDTILTGIGQSVTMLTPIGVARYISAIVNGGDVYEATLIKSIITPDGVVRDQAPTLVRTLNANPNYLKAIKEGMSSVVNGEDGTAADYFADFKYKDQIGGKTGTAQVSKIDLEDNSWFVCFAPFDKPEIAVVVYIPNGYKGIRSAYTAREIVQYYLDRKDQQSVQQTLPQVNTLVK